MVFVVFVVLDTIDSCSEIVDLRGPGVCRETAVVIFVESVVWEETDFEEFDRRNRGAVNVSGPIMLEE